MKDDNDGDDDYDDGVDDKDNKNNNCKTNCRKSNKYMQLRSDLNQSLCNVRSVVSEQTDTQTK